MEDIKVLFENELKALCGHCILLMVGNTPALRDYDMARLYNHVTGFIKSYKLEVVAIGERWEHIIQHKSNRNEWKFYQAFFYLGMCGVLGAILQSKDCDDFVYVHSKSTRFYLDIVLSGRDE